MKPSTMFEQIKDLPPTLLSAILAVFIAAIRVVYDQEETSAIRISLEATLCGALAVVAGTGINAMGLDQNWTLFVGGIIGFVGSQSIRTYAERFIEKKVTEKD